VEDIEVDFDRPDNFTEMKSEDQLAFMIQAMKKAANNLDFETAMVMRDEVKALKARIKKRNSKRK